MKAFLSSSAFAIVFVKFEYLQALYVNNSRGGDLGDNSYREFSKLCSTIKINELSLCLCY